MTKGELISDIILLPDSAEILIYNDSNYGGRFTPVTHALVGRSHRPDIEEDSASHHVVLFTTRFTVRSE